MRTLTVNEISCISGGNGNDNPNFHAIVTSLVVCATVVGTLGTWFTAFATSNFNLPFFFASLVVPGSAFATIGIALCCLCG